MNAPVRPLRPWDMNWVYRQSPVETFNGRRGHVCLALPDIIWAGGAPICNPVFIGAPSSQLSPPPNDDSTRLATTAWVQDLIATLAPTQGPPGPQGPPGTGIVFLGSVPTQADLPTNATEGDMYVALDTGVLYVWDGGHWVSVQPAPAGAQGPIGPQGPQGMPGTPGTNGTNGAPGAPGAPGTGFQVLGSVTDPSELPPTGNHNGDVYIDTTTGQGYVWDGTAWVPFALGPTGPPGAPGATGAQGPPGAAGTNGTNGAPGPAGATGPAGPTGAQGPQGAQGPAGSASGVTAWNGRTGSVTMSAADITNAGGLANPNVALTGTPTAPTAPAGTNSTQLATTGYVFTNFVKIPGDTMTGALSIFNSSGTPGVKLNITGQNSSAYTGGSVAQAADICLSAGNTFNRQILGATNGALRWSLALGNSATESGSNVGSGFAISRFSDGGALLDLPIQIARANGVVSFSQAIVNGPSDVAFKEDIQPLAGALDKVMRLKGVSYRMKKGPRHRQIGLLANDVERVVPEVVQDFCEEEGGKKFKALDYPKLTALLIEAMKELAAKVERRH